MRVIDPRAFTGERAWAALDIAAIDGATVRLHWTDQPYIWHINDGEEVFVVLDGAVEMKTRRDGIESSHRLSPGDIFHASAGDEHVAHPLVPSRILVIERAGSV